MQHHPARYCVSHMCKYTFIQDYFIFLYHMTKDKIVAGFYLIVSLLSQKISPNCFWLPTFVGPKWHRNVLYSFSILISHFPFFELTIICIQFLALGSSGAKVLDSHLQHRHNCLNRSECSACSEHIPGTPPTHQSEIEYYHWFNSKSIQHTVEVMHLSQPTHPSPVSIDISKKIYHCMVYKYTETYRICLQIKS